MQVTLTPHAAELLRQAMARNPEKAPEQIIEQALEDGAASSPDAVRERLKSIPGTKLPLHSPPRFKQVKPLKTDGELPSETLIRERR